MYLVEKRYIGWWKDLQIHEEENSFCLLRQFRYRWLARTYKFICYNFKSIWTWECCYEYRIRVNLEAQCQKYIKTGIL